MAYSRFRLLQARTTSASNKRIHLLARSGLGNLIRQPVSLVKLLVPVSSCHPMTNELLSTYLRLYPTAMALGRVGQLLTKNLYLYRVEPEEQWRSG